MNFYFWTRTTKIKNILPVWKDIGQARCDFCQHAWILWIVTRDLILNFPFFLLSIRLQRKHCFYGEMTVNGEFHCASVYHNTHSKHVPFTADKILSTCECNTILSGSPWTHDSLCIPPFPLSHGRVVMTKALDCACSLPLCLCEETNFLLHNRGIF